MYVESRTALFYTHIFIERIIPSRYHIPVMLFWIPVGITIISFFRFCMNLASMMEFAEKIETADQFKLLCRRYAFGIVAGGPITWLLWLMSREDCREYFEKELEESPYFKKLAPP
jgi:hypothetical protein